MIGFDEYIIRWLNSYANRVPDFDSLMLLLLTNLLKGGIIAALIWWAWFRTEGDIKRNREIMLSTLAGAFVSMFTAHGLALILPFRFRPIHNPEIAFQLPYGMVRKALDGWSSFPSDHAALFFALTVGLWMVSRRIGIVALLHTVFIISFPRVYLGLHYPTDIIFGATIGVCWVALINIPAIKNLTVRPAMFWLEHHAMSFYAAFFLLTEQIATIFDDTSTVAGAVIAVLKRLF